MGCRYSYERNETVLKISNKEYEILRRVVYDNSRINLGSEKYELVSSRVAKRLRALNLDSYATYCDYLGSPSGKEELGHLIDAISTNYTYFYRETHHLDFLASTILPNMMAQKRFSAFNPFKIWSAACATGEEPYTLAIILSEFFGPQNIQSWKLLATDISTTALQTAKAGIYKHDKLKLPNPTMLRTYFQKGQGNSEGLYRVKAPIRENIQFKQYNLLQPNDQLNNSTFDVIFCRNVMIYFDRDTQQELVNKLETKLTPDGYLIAGCSESLSSIRHGMTPHGSSIYQRQGVTH